ncbi:MAG: hypothetical protein MRERV_3c066 [Mycoplasmataceae bacterium RV_VA103A]|nr:MAG: hypothetical protein MRERV_3c066 [Mycoplasmataceae bacterium RV_VA103A]
MPLPAVAAVAVKAIPWIVGLIGGIYATKKVTESFGSTPANDLRQIPGMERMSPKQMYNDRKQWRQDRVKYHKKRNEKIEEEIDKKNEQVQKLEEKITRMAEEVKNTSDPTEKNRLMVAIEASKKEVKDLKGEIGKLQKAREEGDKKVDDIYQGFDDTSTQEQFVERSNSINWTSWKNYGIIFVCIVVLFMLIGFIKKLFASLLGAVK